MVDKLKTATSVDTDNSYPHKCLECLLVRLQSIGYIYILSSLRENLTCSRASIDCSARYCGQCHVHGIAQPLTCFKKDVFVSRSEDVNENVCVCVCMRVWRCKRRLFKPNKAVCPGTFYR